MPFLLKSKPITIEKWKVDRSIITGHRPLFVYLKNNSKYIGEWKNNLKDGFGIKYQSNGLIYDGQWKNGMRHGFGKIQKKLENKLINIYVGEFKNNYKNGEGKQFFENGIYFGYWKMNKKSELGIMWFKNQSIYIGEWKENQFHGAGILFQENGNRYEGLWKNGLKHGFGVFFHNLTGQVQTGIWETDICKTSTMKDESRNQALMCTGYPIPIIKLRNPTEVISKMFKKFNQIENETQI